VLFSIPGILVFRIGLGFNKILTYVRAWHGLSIEGGAFNFSKLFLWRYLMFNRFFLSLLALIVGGALTINAADDPSRFRLYYPASTSATVSDCSTCTVTAEGYSLHYVFGFGLGLGTSSSKAKVSGDTSSTSEYSYDADSMLDLSYTFGSDFTFTLGYGVGSAKLSGHSSVTTTSGSSSNSLIGLGYNFDGIEILLGIRMVSANIKGTYQANLGGTMIDFPLEVKTNWNTTDIGIGFTF